MPCFGIRSTISDETRCPFEFEKTNFIIYELLPILHLLSLGGPIVCPFQAAFLFPPLCNFVSRIGFERVVRRKAQPLSWFHRLLKPNRSSS